VTQTAFELYQPTQVVSGHGVAARVASFAQLFGTRALVITGGASARACCALGDVEDSLKRAGMEFDYLEGVPTNPSCAVVDAGGTLVRAEGIDVVIAVGGGSVIDVAKAVATVAVSRLSYRRYLSGLRDGSERLDATLPVIAVPTLPGSGSETNGTSVVVDDITGRKLSAHSDLAAPRVALLDATYAAHAPRELLALGMVDALCHAIEAALSPRATVASDALAEAAISMLLRDAPLAIEAEPPVVPGSPDGLDGDDGGPAPDWSDACEALARCVWATNLAGQALSLSGSIATHPLAHPISARCGAHHGATVALLEPVVLALHGERYGADMVKLARWIGAPHNAGVAASTRRVVNRLVTLNRKLGVAVTAEGLGLTPELVDELVADALASGSRGLEAPPSTPAFDGDDLRAVYDAAIETRPANVGKELVGRPARALPA
jgi:alcohol dehydrogenase class IV